MLICLFALPFAGFGLFAISMAVHLFGARPGSQEFWFPLLFGVVFSSIGFGLMFLVLTGSKRYARQQRLQAEHPTEPWLWRADWAQGRVKSDTRTNMIRGWVFAIFWNLFSLPIAFLVVPEAIKRSPAGYVAVLFPAVGVFLLINAIRKTLELWEFGNTYFEMASVPGVVGCELKGAIQARFAHSPNHGIRLRLTCAHRTVTGSGNTQSTQESILWRDEPSGTCSFNSPARASPSS